MDTEKIKELESVNLGQMVHLYYDDIAGLYAGFGMSAFCVTTVTDPFISYSEKLQMPVALLTRPQILYLRQSMKKEEHTAKSYYRFRLLRSIGDSGYGKWAKTVKAAHEKVI